MKKTKIQKRLFDLRDEKYAEFQIKLIPGMEEERLIGVRTPALRNLAKELVKEDAVSDFLTELPHYYFDENQLHAFIISLEKDFGVCIQEVEAFLPYVNNWATCDQLLPKAFKKEPEALLPYIKKWLRSKETYTVRFAIGLLMQFFLDEKFQLSYAETVAKIRSKEYYINMMIAWYFATALAKQYDSVLPFIEQKRLEKWTHNKTIQKSVESYRIPEEHKDYLRSLRIH